MPGILPYRDKKATRCYSCSTMSKGLYSLTGLFFFDHPSTAIIERNHSWPRKRNPANLLEKPKPQGWLPKTGLPPRKNPASQKAPPKVKLLREKRLPHRKNPWPSLRNLPRLLRRLNQLLLRKRKKVASSSQSKKKKATATKQKNRTESGSIKNSDCKENGQAEACTAGKKRKCLRKG